MSSPCVRLIRNDEYYVLSAGVHTLYWFASVEGSRYPEGGFEEKDPSLERVFHLRIAADEKWSEQTSTARSLGSAARCIYELGQAREQRRLGTTKFCFNLDVGNRTLGPLPVAR